MKGFQVIRVKVLGNFHFILAADLRWCYVHSFLQIRLETLIKPVDNGIPFIMLQLLQILFILREKFNGLETIIDRLSINLHHIGITQYRWV